MAILSPGCIAGKCGAFCLVYYQANLVRYDSDIIHKCVNKQLELVMRSAAPRLENFVVGELSLITMRFRSNLYFSRTE